MSERIQHKYAVGQIVTLPGDRIRSPHYRNQFLYNKTGTIEKLGWSKNPVSVKDEKIFQPDGVSYFWSKKLVHIPMYFIGGRWYREGRKNLGVTR